MMLTWAVYFQEQSSAGRIPLQITQKPVPADKQLESEKTGSEQETLEKSSLGKKGVHLVPR